MNLSERYLKWSVWIATPPIRFWYLACFHNANKEQQRATLVSILCDVKFKKSTTKIPWQVQASPCPSIRWLEIARNVLFTATIISLLSLVIHGARTWVVDLLVCLSPRFKSVQCRAYRWWYEAVQAVRRNDVCVRILFESHAKVEARVPVHQRTYAFWLLHKQQLANPQFNRVVGARIVMTLEIVSFHRHAPSYRSRYSYEIAQ